MRNRALVLIISSCWLLSGAVSKADTPILSDQQTVTLYNEGVALISNHHPTEAAEKFKAAIVRTPDFAEAHSNLGVAYVQLGKYSDALTELKQATELKPSSGASWGTLGTCYQTLGRSKEALHAFEMYLKLEPNSPDAARLRSGVALLKNEILRTAGEASDSATTEDYFAAASQNGIERWPKSRMPITIFIKEGTDVPGYDPEFATILKAAFQDWENASEGKVKLSFDTTADTAKIFCKWTNDPSQMMSSAEGGHAMVIPDSQGIIKTDITLLTVPPAAMGPKMKANYAKRIYLHEIGHALGILGHSTAPDDVMFSTIPPADIPVDLTKRDKATLVALYSASDETVHSHPLNMSKMLMSGDPSSAVNQVVRLNSEASDAMKKGNLVLAIEKLEAARKIDPNSELIANNLGTAYANGGSLAMAARSWKLAEEYFAKSIPFLEHSPDPNNLLSALKAYSFVLHTMHKTAEAQKIDARVQSLGGASH